MWEQLTMSERSQALKNARAQGITDIQEIERMLETEAHEQVIEDEAEQASYAQNTDASESDFENNQNEWNNVAAYRNDFINQAIAKRYSYGGPTKPNFVLRLEDPNRKYIRDWVNPDDIATHKLGWFTEGNHAVVYPEVQEINGKLIDFTRPPYARNAGIESAIQRGDTIHMTPRQAEWFTQMYKGLYPKGNTFVEGGHLFWPGGNANPIWAKYLTVPEETEEEKNKRITAANTYEVSPQRIVFTKATLAAPDYKTPTSLQSDNTSVSVPVSTVAEQEAIQAQKEAEVRQRIYNNTVRPVSNQEMSNIEHGHKAEEWMLKPANKRLEDAANAALTTALVTGTVIDPFVTIPAIIGGFTGPDDPEELARQLKAAVDASYRELPQQVQDNTRNNINIVTDNKGQIVSQSNNKSNTKNTTPQQVITNVAEQAKEAINTGVNAVKEAGIKIAEYVAPKIKSIIGMPRYFGQYFLSKFSDDDVIDLSNKNVNRITSNTGNVDNILTNEFVERNANTVRLAKDFKSTTDTLLGDRKIPLRDISTFYGVVNGKLKVGPLSSFSPEAEVVANRARNYGKVTEIVLPYKPFNRWEKEKVNKAIRQYNSDHGYNDYQIWNPATWNPRARLVKAVGTEESHRIVDSLKRTIWPDRKYFSPYLINTEGDTIPFLENELNAAPKILFGDENGNALFVSGLRNNINEINNWLKQHPAYPVMVDNGRYSTYQNYKPNVYSYSGLENPDNMFIIGTTK